MTGVLSGFTVIAVVIGLGYTVARGGVLGPAGQEVLSRIAFFVAMPALLFSTLCDTDLRDVFSAASLVTASSALAVVCLYALLSRLAWRRPVGETVVGALCAAYVNSGNLGIPIAAYVLGDASYAVPVMLFQLVVLAPLSFAVLDSATGQRAERARTAVLRPLRNPVIVASACGLLVAATGLRLPEALLEPFELVGAMAVPAALLAFGASLQGAPLPGAGGLRRQLTAVGLLKVVVHPAIAYAIAHWALGMEGTPLLAATMTAALPTAQNVFVYAYRYGQGVHLARDSIVTTTVAAIPVIVLVAALLGTH